MNLIDSPALGKQTGRSASIPRPAASGLWRMRLGLAWLACVLLAYPNTGGLAWGANSQPAGAPFAVAHDAPLQATEKVVNEAKNYEQLRVEFNGIQGDRVPAFLYVPRSGTGPKSSRTPAGTKYPAVLLQYGSGGHKGSDYIVAVGRLFVAHGFVVLTIDAPEKGERAPKQKKQLTWLDIEHGRDVFRQYLGDYSRAVDYLKARPDVDARRIGFVGISWGAITGITFVAHDPRVKAMACLVGGGDILARLPPELPDKIKQMIKPLDPVNNVGLIAPRPLLMINVTRDQLIPRACAQALHKAAGKGSKVVWLKTDHYFHGLDRTKVTESVIQFLQQSMPAR